MTRRAWTVQEVAILRAHYESGGGRTVAAALAAAGFQRDLSTIHTKARQYGLTAPGRVRTRTFRSYERPTLEQLPTASIAHVLHGLGRAIDDAAFELHDLTSRARTMAGSLRQAIEQAESALHDLEKFVQRHQAAVEEIRRRMAAVQVGAVEQPTKAGATKL